MSVGSIFAYNYRSKLPLPLKMIHACVGWGLYACVSLL